MTRRLVPLATVVLLLLASAAASQPAADVEALRAAGASLKGDPGRPVIALDWYVPLQIDQTKNAPRVGRLTSLKSVSLTGLGVTDAFLHPLGQLPALEEVALNQASVGDVGLKAVCKNKSIRSLSVASCTFVTDDGFARAGDLPALEEFCARDASRLTDKGVIGLAKARQLRRVRLADTEVGDLGVNALADLPRLELLDLSRTNVTDAALKRLVRVPTLRVLDIGGTLVTEEAIRVARAARPDMRIGD